MPSEREKRQLKVWTEKWSRMREISEREGRKDTTPPALHFWVPQAKGSGEEEKDYAGQRRKKQQQRMRGKKSFLSADQSAAGPDPSFES